MRSLTFCSAVLLACVVTTPLSATELHIAQHAAQGSLLWRDAGRVLGVHADAKSGIVVTQTEIGGTWGLQQGDVVLAVDGRPVREIGALVERLRASQPAAVHTSVQRGDAAREVTVAADDYRHLIAPRPPAPPRPPVSHVAPPPPPAPPAPPSDVTVNNHEEQRLPTLAIRPGVVIAGPIVAERGGVLKVSRQAKIGVVQGMSVQWMDGPAPAPQPEAE